MLYPQNGWWNSSLPSISPSNAQSYSQPSGSAEVKTLPEKVQRGSNSEAVPRDATETPNEDPFIVTVCQRLGVKPDLRFKAPEVDWLPAEGCSVRDLVVCLA